MTVGLKALVRLAAGFTLPALVMLLILAVWGGTAQAHEAHGGPQAVPVAAETAADHLDHQASTQPASPDSHHPASSGHCHCTLVTCTSLNAPSMSAEPAQPAAVCLVPLPPVDVRAEALALVPPPAKPPRT